MSIHAAHGDSAAAQWQQMQAENERLVAQCSRDAEEMDSAHAARDAALKAAETDSLTGLPNRVFLWDRMAHDMAVARRHGALLAVYFLDLDGLKSVNDQFGHDIVTASCRPPPAAVGTPCTLGGHDLLPSASIGASLFPVDGEEPGTLIRKADAAMYQAKRLKKHAQSA